MPAKTNGTRLELPFPDGPARRVSAMMLYGRSASDASLSGIAVIGPTTESPDSYTLADYSRGNDVAPPITLLEN